MQIMITGAGGTIGKVLMEGLSHHDVVGIDRLVGPYIVPLDLTDRSRTAVYKLEQLLRGADAVIHLAWDTREHSTKLDELFTDAETASAHQKNVAMSEHILWAAHRAHVRRFIFGSSVHAMLGYVPGYTYPESLENMELHTALHRPLKISTRKHPKPSGGVYGASKIYVESLGYSFALTHGMEFVAIRFGNVREDNDPKKSEYPFYLSHRDCVQFIELCLTTSLQPPGQVPYAIFTAVSDNACCPFSLNDERYYLGYGPQDGTPCPFDMAQ
jgi:nucleoside-diphosphate-sugar epimerase